MLNIAASVLLIAVVVTAVLALANAISGITPPRLDQQTSAVTPYALEPQECKNAGINPTAILTASAPVGTVSQLILGGATGTTLRGRGGGDCILGGGGNDYLRGDAGTDVCMGGGGTDTFQNCEYQY